EGSITVAKPASIPFRSIMPFPSISRIALVTGMAALLGGCATFSPDGGVGVAQNVAFTELNKDVVKINDDGAAISAKGRVDQLLK
ncbi:MAG: hypothetical protein ACREB5_11775, partial [Sphingomonadaceae bacterium]